MTLKQTWIAIALILALTLVVGVFAFPQLPEQIVSHWNFQGVPDGTMGRVWGVVLFPLAMLGVSLLLMYLPMIDPLRENIQRFRNTYNMVIVFFNVYFFYIHLLVVLWNLGIEYKINLAIVPAVAILFYVIAFLMEKTSRNWFIGIRTPWTLSSDLVWEKTHQRAALVFKIGAGLMLIGIVLPSVLFALIMVSAFGAATYLVLYSYIVYRKEKSGQSD